jgi:hypothetical protein
MKIYVEQIKRNLEVKKVQAYKAAVEIKNWCVEHPQETITLLGLGVGLVKAGSNVYSKHQTKVNLKREEEMKSLYMYDRSKGRYQRLRHPMSPQEAIEYEERRRNGESFMEALMNLRLV